jgi:deoxyribodipyrimidine photo-lyase
VAVPAIRIRAANGAPVRGDRDFVLYWMIASRRADWNFALDRAAERARELGKPLVVLEALRCDYPWASPRLHRFVLDGMLENRRRFEGRALYHPYVEPSPGAGKGLLEALAAKACVVVTDDSPSFFLPRMVEAAARKLPVLLEAVDSNGLLPLRASGRAFPTAHSFRRFLQKELPRHLDDFPRARPLRAGLPLARLPAGVARRWPAWDGALLPPLPLDLPPTGLRGGAGAWRGFDAARYPERKSGLSPYLHFGHVSTHRVFRELAEREGWDPGRLAPSGRGARRGWWGMSEAAEAFLDQLVTWRELGFHMAAHRADHERYESLPAWARTTLGAHAKDRRAHVYALADFEGARTHDEVWNAAQRQLVREGTIDGYLRMLWGKKILEWTRSPRVALAVMVELNNKYALDGRDPNSYSGIFWVLGRYDRPWGPERPVFGKVRYMSSESARRKRRLGSYLERFGRV